MAVAFGSPLSQHRSNLSRDTYNCCQSSDSGALCMNTGHLVVFEFPLALDKDDNSLLLDQCSSVFALEALARLSSTLHPRS